MKCTKCNSPIKQIVRLEITELKHVKKFFLCENKNCGFMEVIYSDRRDTTPEEYAWAVKQQGGLY